MVTGNKNTGLSIQADAALGEGSLKENHIVVSLSPTGFSVIGTDAEKQKILLSAYDFWSEIEELEQLLKRFEKCLGQIGWALEEAASTRVLINYNKFSLVPEQLYEKEQGPAILSYSCKLAKGEHIYSDHWKQSKAILVYASPVRLVEWIKRRFPTAAIQHQGSAMEELYRILPKEGQFAFLHVNPHTADFYLAKEGQLQWYNNFDYATEEDLLYFILYSLEQNRILPTELKLKLSGHSLKGDKLQVLLERYIGELKEMSLPVGFSQSSDISLQELRANFNLIGGLWPEL